MYKLSKDHVIVKIEEYVWYEKFATHLIDTQIQNWDSVNICLTGETSTFKSSLLKSLQRQCSTVNKYINIPLSAYLSLKTFKDSIETQFGSNARLPWNNLIIIDDLHLQSNLTTNLLEFLWVWISQNGYYNIKEAQFSSLGKLHTVMAHDLKFGNSNFDITSNRYLYQSLILYVAPISS